MARIGGHTVARWHESLSVNLVLPAFLTRTLEPALKRSGHASVVYYGSIDGIRGNPRVPAYSVARAGLIPLTHIAAHRLGPSGGRANCIAGASLTPNGPEVPADRRGPGADMEELLRLTPLGRIAQADEVAGVVAFLASSDSSYLTGSMLTVDGGRTAITPGTGLPVAH